MTAPQTRAIDYAGSRDVFPNPGRGFLVPYHPAQKDEILPPLPAERLRVDRENGAGLFTERGLIKPSFSEAERGTQIALVSAFRFFPDTELPHTELRHYRRSDPPTGGPQDAGRRRAARAPIRRIHPAKAAEAQPMGIQKARSRASSVTIPCPRSMKASGENRTLTADRA